MHIADLIGAVSLIAIVAAGGGLSAAWWLQADAMQKNIERLSAESQHGMLSFRAASIEKQASHCSPALCFPICKPA